MEVILIYSVAAQQQQSAPVTLTAQTSTTQQSVPVTSTVQTTVTIQENTTSPAFTQHVQQTSKLESQLSDDQLTIPGNQSTITSTASGVRRAKKKIVLEVLSVAYANGTNQPVFV